ncbi:MAG: hypothetical protein AAFQ22_10055 [Pseudomonadota bacterium]
MLRTTHCLAVIASGLAACTASPNTEVPVQTPSVAASNLAVAQGAWVGTLTYLDFTSNEEVALPLELDVQLEDRCLALSFTYPNEPQANSTGTRCLSNDGRTFDDKPVIASTALAGTTSFTLEYEGQDNGMPATKVETYRLSADALSFETAFAREGEADLTVRNTVNVTPAP